MENEVKYEYTKTPLDYQITEYDCGTTTLLNALRYLFKRSEISPEIYKYIMQYTLDKTNENGENCKGGTSTYALEFLCNWLNENGSKKGMNLSCKVLPKEDCSIYNQELNTHIQNGGVAILRLYQDCEHYCLLTALDDEYAYMFDPYYLNINYLDNDDCCEIIKDRPFEFNRKVSKVRVDDTGTKDFTLVQGENREIILISRI